MKKIVARLKLMIEAGKATPAPPVGPALAPYGINLKEFCEIFNSKTRDKMGFILPVKVKIYDDKSFDLEIKTPLTSELLKKAAKIEKGSGQPKKIKVGKITREQLRKIAQIKLEDLNTTDIEKAMKIIEAQAKNMGIEIID